MKIDKDFYYQRFAARERQIGTRPRPDLAIVVVIPCFNEPDLVGSLESLRACDPPAGSVEVIVVINAPAGCDASIRSQNDKTLVAASKWSAKQSDPRFAIHLLHSPELPVKHAGVGWARKIGMDEAARRFDDLGKARDGIVAGFDADCRCERNFLSSIERHFQRHPRCPGGSIYFEHPLDGPMAAENYEAIAAYELHLRYYIQALRYAGFPHAFHTLGSCMAVRAEIYKRQGGMNRRKAGEDFYFLHKIIPLGGFADLTETTVYPSPRASDRVPFGTGKAVTGFLNLEPVRTYPLEAFLELKDFFAGWRELDHPEDFLAGKHAAALPASLNSYLFAQEFSKAQDEIRRNTSNETTFRKRFFAWFNGFQAMKFIHHARDQFYGDREVRAEASKLLGLLGGGTGPRGERTMLDLVHAYRDLDRKG